MRARTATGGGVRQPKVLLRCPVIHNKNSRPFIPARHRVQYPRYFPFTHHRDCDAQECMPKSRARARAADHLVPHRLVLPTLDRLGLHHVLPIPTQASQHTSNHSSALPPASRQNLLGTRLCPNKAPINSNPFIIPLPKPILRGQPVLL